MEEVNAMTKKVTAFEARQNLGELMEEVYYRNDHVVITRRNKAMVVMIPAEEYNRLLAQRKLDLSVIGDVRTQGLRPDIVEQDISAARARLRAKKKTIHAKSDVNRLLPRERTKTPCLSRKTAS